MVLRGLKPIFARLDPHPFSRGGSWAILTISMMHIYQALILSWWPQALRATDMTALFLALRMINLQIHVPSLQIIMILSSILALIGAFFRVGRIRLIVFLPQHLIIGAMAWGGLYASYVGHYLDGTHVSWAHISVDQIGYLSLFSIHSSAIIRRYRDPNG